MTTTIKLKVKLRYATIQNNPDYMRKLIEFNDQRTLGAYSIVGADLTKMVVVDDEVAIPAGLPVGFQSVIANSLSVKSPFTIAAEYTTVIGAQTLNISANSFITIAILDSSTIVISGLTEV